MNYKSTYKPLFALTTLLLMLVCSCGIRVKGAKRGDNASVETFLVENGIIQYFVKPLTFSSPSTDIRIDFTFRGKNDSLFKAKINFTVANTKTSKIDSYNVVDYTTNEAVITVYKPRTSMVNTGLRYFSEVTNNTLFHLFESGHSLTIITFSNGNPTIFTPSKKAARKIKKIPQTLISD
jgi:hypothetical protein